MSFRITRRKLLQAASVTAISMGLPKMTKAEPGVVASELEAKGCLNDETVVGGVCEMCFWRCQIIGKKRSDRLVKLEGNPKSIDNGSSICARGNAGVQMLYDPDRLS